MADEVLQVTNISKRYAGVPALHDVSLSLAAGEIAAWSARMARVNPP